MTRNTAHPLKSNTIIFLLLLSACGSQIDMAEALLVLDDSYKDFATLNLEEISELYLPVFYEDVNKK